MSVGRHSYVRFYPSDWLAGTARLPRLHKSVFFDICCYIWDTAKPCPPMELLMMLSDLPTGAQIVDELVAMGKLSRNPDGSVENVRAMAEVHKSVTSWKKMADGGKKARLNGASMEDAMDHAMVDGIEDGNTINGGWNGASIGDAHEPEPLTTNQNHEPESPKGDSPPTPSAGVAIAAVCILQNWNAMARGTAGKIKGAKALNDQRRAAIKARLREHSLEDIQAAIATIPQSAFLRGENDRGWVANFDWLLQPSSMMKLIEGAYHGQRSGKKSGWLA